MSRSNQATATRTTKRPTCTTAALRIGNRKACSTRSDLARTTASASKWTARAATQTITGLSGQTATACTATPVTVTECEVDGRGWCYDKHEPSNDLSYCSSFWTKKVWLPVVGWYPLDYLMFCFFPRNLIYLGTPGVYVYWLYYYIKLNTTSAVLTPAWWGLVLASEKRIIK